MTWVFAYAADSGPLNAALDWAHKLVSPSTYPCRLCTVTYGLFGQKTDWKEILAELPGEKEFLHRDEFVGRYPDRPLAVPSIWTIQEGRWELVVGPDGWASLGSLSELERRLQSALAGYNRGERV